MRAGGWGPDNPNTHHKMLKWFLRKLKTNPNWIFLNKEKGVAEEIEN